MSLQLVGSPATFESGITRGNVLTFVEATSGKKTYCVWGLQLKATSRRRLSTTLGKPRRLSGTIGDTTKSDVGD